MAGEVTFTFERFELEDCMICGIRSNCVQIRDSSTAFFDDIEHACENCVSEAIALLELRRPERTKRLSLVEWARARAGFRNEDEILEIP